MQKLVFYLRNYLTKKTSDISNYDIGKTKITH